MAFDKLVIVSFWSTMMFRLSTMIMLGVMISSLITLWERKDGIKRLRGTKLFCTLLILASIYKLWGFLDYSFYQHMFHQLPEKAIFFRYLGSVALRIAGLILAVGILLLKDFFRKVFLLLCVFTLVALYWKHPYYVFENISRGTEQLFLGTSVVDKLTYPFHPWISMVFHLTIDIVFCGSALYYFTRPKVRAQFS